MILTGKGIATCIKDGTIEIEPYNENQLNPNSYNLRLHNELICYQDGLELDMKKNNDYRKIVIPEEGYQLRPGKLYLGRTVERTKTDVLVPGIEGRSSVGRLGINIHATAGFGDIGFNGFWTLELSCIEPVWIYPWVEICQIYYHLAFGHTDLKYNSGKYQNNEDIQTSKLWKEFLDK